MATEDCSIYNANESMTHNNDTYMQEQMLLHLHEQYAVNNNAKLESAVSLIVGLIAVIGAYGYVFVHTSIKIGEAELLNSKAEFTILSLILTATAAIIVLAIMKYICMYQGFAQRRDQFIIFAIRCYHGLKIKNKDKERIFPDTYHPFDKNGLEIYQGLFGEFIKISTIIQAIIIISTIVICCILRTHNKDCICDNLIVINSIIIFIVVSIFCFCFCKYKECKDTLKYEKLCNSFKEYKPILNNTRF